MKVNIEVSELASLLDKLRPIPLRVSTKGSRRPRILMTKSAYRHAVDALTSREPEFAIFLLGPKDHPALITHVVPDTTGEGTPVSFRVGAKRLNEVLRQYTPLGLDGKGFWHTHPDGNSSLSSGDLAFVHRLFANPKNDVREIIMPVMSSGLVYPYIVRRDRPETPLAAKLVLL